MILREENVSEIIHLLYFSIYRNSNFRNTINCPLKQIVPSVLLKIKKDCNLYLVSSTFKNFFN